MQGYNYRHANLTAVIKYSMEEKAGGILSSFVA